MSILGWGGLDGLLFDLRLQRRQSSLFPIPWADVRLWLPRIQVNIRYLRWARMLSNRRRSTGSSAALGNIGRLGSASWRGIVWVMFRECTLVFDRHHARSHQRTLGGWFKNIRPTLQALVETFDCLLLHDDDSCGVATLSLMRVSGMHDS